MGINASGDVAGYYYDANVNEYAFVDDKGTFTTIDPPNATITEVAGINDSGEVAGYYYDNNNNELGFIYDKGTVTTIDPPGATVTVVTGINNGGEVAGNYSDSNGDHYGFVYDKGTFTTIDPPGASFTEVTSINNGGEVAGRYIDSSGNQHGFTATDPPTASPAMTLNDVLTSQTSQISTNDLVPGSAAISGQLAPVTNSPGSVDILTGANFGGLAFAGMTDTSLQVLMKGNG